MTSQKQTQNAEPAILHTKVLNHIEDILYNN